MDINFWARCLHAQCSIVPVRMYEKFDADGNFNEAFYRGPRFVAISTEGSQQVSGPDFHFSIEECAQGHASFHLTPEAALAAFEVTRSEL